MSDLRVRTLTGTDPHDYLAYAGPGTADVTDRFGRYLAAGSFRAEWMYVAIRDDTVLARGAFYGPPDSVRPVALDHFDIRPGTGDGAGVGAALLRGMYGAVHGQQPLPDLHMFLPARWRDTRDSNAIVTRIAAASQAGLSVLVERHRFEWLPDADPGDGAVHATGAVPETELCFEASPDDEIVVDLLRDISNDSLDAGTRRGVEQLGVDGAARSYLSDMDRLPGGREHWLVARDASDAPIGLVIATMHSRPHPLVAFVGVDPAHRGLGYGRMLLDEATQRLVAAGADRVRGDTDLPNTPMVSVFEGCGWREWATRLVMHLPSKSVDPGSRLSSSPAR